MMEYKTCLLLKCSKKNLIIDIYKCNDILFYILHVIISLLVVFQHEDNSTIYQIFNQHIKLENTGIFWSTHFFESFHTLEISIIL